MKKADYTGIIGSQYGRMTVIELTRNQKGKLRAECRCECGRTVLVAPASVVGGKTKSCCCYRKTVSRNRLTTHGGSKTATYRCWKAMKARCLNINNPLYRYYGARGITVCDRWRDDFSVFLRDVGERPSPAHSLDRYPDGNGNYEPGNVRWATDLEQNRNKPEYNHWVEWNGERRCLSEWASILGFDYDLVQNRLAKGWDFAEAIKAPSSPLPRPSRRFPHPGVNIHVCGRYCAYAGHGKSRKYIGMFGTVEEAQAAIQRVEVEMTA